VVVIASLGGARLRASLDSAAWAPRRAVIDPTGGADLSALPGAAARWRMSELAEQVEDDWVLLLAEGELVTAGLEAAIVRATATEGAHAFRVALECAAFGATLRPRGAPVRLCRGLPAGMGISDHGQLSLYARGRAPHLGEAVHVASAGTSLIEGVYELDRDAAAWAALAPGDAPIGTVHTLRVGTMSLLRTLLGRASGRLGWGRLVLAVLHGYRAVLTFGKRWEAQRGPAT
jgi:hypothetical protein